MFTGIVKGQGHVEAIAPPRTDGSRRIRIRAGFTIADIPIGGSMATDGVCLTIVTKRGRTFAADLGPETLDRTTLGALSKGRAVHLEPALRAGDPLGGHIVAGHVDAVGIVRASQMRGDARAIRFEAPARLATQLVEKGSITVDGVSLTINAVDGPAFEVMLIPHTLAVTKLGALRARDRVNLETDIIAKHVERLAGPYLARLGGARARGAKARRALR